MENEADQVAEATEAPTTTPTPVERKKPGRKKETKFDKVLKAIHQVVQVLSHLHDTVVHASGTYTRLTDGVVQQLKTLSALESEQLLVFRDLRDLINNLYGCSINTNGFVASSHNELTSLNASLIELNQMVRALRASGPLDINRPPLPPPPPSAPTTPPLYASAPPGAPPWSPPASPTESLVSLLADLTDKQAYKLARDFGLFTKYDEDDFLRTDGLRQAQWIAERLPNQATIFTAIREKVEEYRKFRNGGYKTRKVQ